MGGSGHDGDGLHLDEEHEEHENHEAWVIPYADMLTLLMALFMMLYAISSVDLAKFEKLASGLSDTLGGGASAATELGSGVVGGGGAGAGAAAPGLVEVTVPDPAPVPQVPAVDGEARAEQAEQALAREERRAAAVAEDRDQLAAIERHIDQHAHAAGIASSIGYRHETRGLVVTVVTDQIMFHPGRAEVQPAGAELLAELARTLRDVPNPVTIEGHTDDTPISTARYRSNWELSTARATEVLRQLVALGVAPERLAASGYGEQQPAAPNDQPEGRTANRRVELVVHSLVSPG